MDVSGKPFSSAVPKEPSRLPRRGRYGLVRTDRDSGTPLGVGYCLYPLADVFRFCLPIVESHYTAAEIVLFYQTIPVISRR